MFQYIKSEMRFVIAVIVAAVLSVLDALCMPLRMAGVAPGMVGSAAVRGSTLLTARHLRLGEDGEYHEVKWGKRRVLNRAVTDAYVNALVDAHQAATYINDYKYHDSGTGTVAEDASDTGLGTPTGVARETGTQTEGGSANIYKSVATITYDGSYAVTEHGLFNAATGGTLMDRTKFAAINVENADKIEFSFTISFSSGG